MTSRYRTACAAFGLLAAAAAHAEDPANPPAPAATPPALGPAFSGPMAPNPDSFNFELGGFGKVYVGGVVSGFGQVQSNSVFGDKSSRGDLSNGMVIVQKVDGVVQFYLQAGLYSFPSIGTPYLKATTNTDETFGALPIAYLKIAPTANFSVQVGKLPTLIGAEGVFSFQNINVDRGLLWNQENVVNRGVQGNLTLGKLTLNLALSDGFYSGKYDWLTGLATYAFSPTDSLAFAGGGTFHQNNRSKFNTPFYLNNSQMFNIIYTHNKGKWMIQPYVQYTHVPRLRQTFFDEGDPFTVSSNKASTYGGALLVKYALTPNISLPGRVEYIKSTGSFDDERFFLGSPNLLYGVRSSAWSLTFTPTYTYKVFFARVEANYVHAGHTSYDDGLAFGRSGERRSQVRGLIEVGGVF